MGYLTILYEQQVLVSVKWREHFKYHEMESIWKKVDMTNTKSGYDILLSGPDESYEKSYNKTIYIY